MTILLGDDVVLTGVRTPDVEPKDKMRGTACKPSSDQHWVKNKHHARRHFYARPYASLHVKQFRVMRDISSRHVAKLNRAVSNSTSALRLFGSEGLVRRSR